MSFNTDDPEQMARFLTGLGYPREQVVATIADQYPGVDACALTQAAIEHECRFQGALDQAIAQQEREAVEAEHDLSKSMHGGRE